MKTIPGIENAIQLLGKFQFSEFRIVRKLCFWSEQVGNGFDHKVELIIESEDRSPNYQIDIVCSGVAALSVKDFGGGETRIIGFDIAEVTERQWQDVSWEILDFEHDELGFVCRSLEIVSVQRV